MDHTVTIDRAQQQALTAVVRRRLLTRPSAVVPPIGSVVLLVLVLVLPLERAYRIALPIVLVLALALFVVRVAVPAGRLVRRAYPIGATVWAGFDGERLHIVTPTTDGTTTLAQFRGIGVQQGVVLLRRTDGFVMPIPAAAFDPAELQRFTAAIPPL